VTEAWRAGASARPDQVPTSGTVTSGHWASRAASGTTPAGDSTGSRPDDAPGDDRETRPALVGLRVLGLGAEVRAARRGPVEPALDVVLG
jgi:hypothetical protein